MPSPPEHVIRAAVEAARCSPCAKSRRGAASYQPVGDGFLFTTAFNGPPMGIRCDGSESCRRSCRERCEHAESRAVTDLVAACGYTKIRDDFDVVHVKIDDSGDLVAGGPPSCGRCAVRMLDVGIGGVWLYQTPESIEAMPFDIWPLGLDFKGIGAGVSTVGHVVFYRDDGRVVEPLELARWVRYTAAEFHRATCVNAGIY